MQWRIISAALDSGVVALEPAAGREDEGVFGVRLLDRWLMFYGMKWRELAFGRGAPESSMQELLPRMLLIGTRPLQAATTLEMGVAHASEHRRQRPHFIPGI